MTAPVKDSDRSHWVNRSPLSLRPYLQLSRLDRPVGYWLLALPGWIGLAFASLSHGFASSDQKWAALILIGAIAMRGAGCTYNDIVDQDLDAQVERTALRPLPAGTVTTKQAWIWLFAQCAVGLVVLLCLPRLAQIISLCSIPLVAAYPFMKRITWWPQLWLGLTFNWAVLVAYAAKTGTVSLPLFILYAGLIFWTVGYDTIYACQDIEDDMKIGVKSTARRFGKRVKLGVAVSYMACVILVFISVAKEVLPSKEVYETLEEHSVSIDISGSGVFLIIFLPISLFALHLLWQLVTFKPDSSKNSLRKFKSNFWAALALIIPLLIIGNIH
ncbi:4-hydroxybenzoate octaprenyltransferase [Hellea sp.]|nr:4-hydroxybenzoate octaprenyltransferase [Hellea sp.]